jgi:hypothetical protein
MAPKTTATDADVGAFLAAIPDDRKRADSELICRLMAEETGQPPRMWGTSIVGFGSYHYKGASGREGDWMAIGFSPRKQSLVLYLMDGFEDYRALLAKLGKHSTAKSCLYVKRVADVDLDVLRELMRRSYSRTAAANG